MVGGGRDEQTRDIIHTCIYIAIIIITWLSPAGGHSTQQKQQKHNTLSLHCSTICDCSNLYEYQPVLIVGVGERGPPAHAYNENRLVFETISMLNSYVA